MNDIVVDIVGTPHRTSKSEKLDFDIFAIWSGNRYFVLVSNKGDLFDPSNIDNDIKKLDEEHGGLFWGFIICDKECYQDYTSFLRSRNRTPYMLAQRRSRNEF